MIRGYRIALNGIPTEFAARALEKFLAGLVEDHNPRFRPTPSELAIEARRLHVASQCAERLALSGGRGQKRLEQLERTEPISDEERARVAADLEKLGKKLGEAYRTEDAERERRLSELTQRTRSRFVPDQSPEALTARLKLRPFDVGDPEGDREVA